MLRSSCEKATSKKKRKGKSMLDESLSQSVSADNDKKLMRQDNAIEYKQLISAARNVDINSKSSFFEKFFVIKNSLIFRS